MSPTTFSATNVHATPAAAPVANQATSPRAAEAAEAFEGLLWSSLLAPLSRSLGALGDVSTNALGTSVARSQHDEFYQHLRAMIEFEHD